MLVYFCSEISILVPGTFYVVIVFEQLAKVSWLLWLMDFCLGMIASLSSTFAVVTRAVADSERGRVRAHEHGLRCFHDAVQWRALRGRCATTHAARWRRAHAQLQGLLGRGTFIALRCRHHATVTKTAYVGALLDKWDAYVLTVFVFTHHIYSHLRCSVCWKRLIALAKSFGTTLEVYWLRYPLIEQHSCWRPVAWAILKFPAKYRITSSSESHKKNFTDFGFQPQNLLCTVNL